MSETIFDLIDQSKSMSVDVRDDLTEGKLASKSTSSIVHAWSNAIDMEHASDYYMRRLFRNCSNSMMEGKLLRWDFQGLFLFFIEGETKRSLPWPESSSGTRRNLDNFLCQGFFLQCWPWYRSALISTVSMFFPPSMMNCLTASILDQSVTRKEMLFLPHISRNSDCSFECYF